MIILGLDIGGANTKAAIIEFNEHEIKRSFSHIEYFPFWEKSLKDVPKMLNRIVLKIRENHSIPLEDMDYIAVAITAELSDAFQTKREGIFKILNALVQVFNQEKLRFISTSNKFLKHSQIQNNYSLICAANWVSTALFLGHFLPECILIDAGSTTIDLIPILNSLPVPKGKTDIERLIYHELIYSGGLRASIPSITHFVPYKGNNLRISFEKFALVSDVHRILNNITEKEYNIDTADNRSTSIENSYARLSRMICMDLETISKEDIDEIAQYIYEKQLEIIYSEIQAFMKNTTKRFPLLKKNPKFVITGLSAEFLVRKSLEKLGFTNISLYKEITHIPDDITSSAFAVAGALHILSSFKAK